MRVDIYKTCTYGCDAFKVMYFHMNSFILKGRQRAVSGVSFCWPSGHLTSGGVILRSLISLLQPICLSHTVQEMRNSNKKLLVREHDSVFTSEYSMKRRIMQGTLKII